ncbi:MAG: Ig-like domain-containing protein, partial [Clostridia bacterium]|nr:Ig-like domain-containing protein [Clostridia bacterium]
TWYQVDCIYDLDAKTLKCYVDGQYIGAERQLSESSGHIINGFIIDVRQSDGSGGARCNVYFDDITVKAVTGEGTFGVSYDESKSTETVKAIKFEEPVSAADVKGVKVVDSETLEEVAVSSITQIDAVTVSVNTGKLSKEGAEYRIVVPGGIKSEWENTSEEATITFNTPDGVEGGGLNVVPDTELFNDEFNYTDMNSALDTPTFDTAKWTNYINVPVAEGLGSYVKNSQLKTDFWNWNGAKSLKTISIFEPQTSGELDIIFDAAVNDQADSSVASYVSIVAHTGDSYSQAANYSYFMAMDGTTLKYSPDMGGGFNNTVSDLTLPNNSTDFRTYKINMNLDAKVAKLYIKEGSDFKELASMTVPAKFTTTGLNGFGLEWYKGGAVPEGTGSIIDNVKVIKKGYSTPYEFEDNFDLYPAVKNAGSDTSTTIGSKWKKVQNVPFQWGIGTYPWNNTGSNNVLRGDWWNYVTPKSTKVLAYTNVDNPVKTGNVVICFDMAVQDINTVESYMTFNVKHGVNDGSGYNPVFKIDGANLFMAATLGNNYDDPDFVNPNTMTDFVSYKIKLDFDAGTAELYAKTTGDYAKIGETTINQWLAGNGMTGVAFEAYKGDGGQLSGQNEGEPETSFLVDNFTIDIGAEVTKPAVKKVRIDDGLTSKDVSCDAKTVKIYFNKKMKEATLGGIQILDELSNPATIENPVYNADECSYTMTISGNLKPGTNYTVSVPTTVIDEDGKSLATAYSGAFATGKGVFSSEIYLNEGSVAATKATTAVGDTLTAGIKINNQAQEEGEYILICSVYDGNKLAYFDFVKVPYSAATPTVDKTVNITVPQTENELGVKVMLWDGFTNIKPVKASMELK